MMSPWTVSLLLQWAVIVLLAVVVLSLVRQLGAMTLRIEAFVEREPGDGPAPHTQIPPHDVTLIDGGMFRVGDRSSRPSLILFLAPGCPSCAGVSVALRQLLSSYPPDALAVLIVLMASRGVAESYLAEQSLQGVPVALLEDFPEHYAPRRGTPFAFATTADGIVAVRGNPRTFAHLQALVQAVSHLGAPPRLEPHSPQPSAAPRQSPAVGGRVDLATSIAGLSGSGRFARSTDRGDGQ